MSQLSSAQRLAAGVHASPTLVNGFATTQAAWRFYSNPRVRLPQLCRPLWDHARRSAVESCDQWMPVVLDWSNLHYNGHASKSDRIELSMRNDLGYEMLTALALSDREGSPLAPLCVELRARDGLHTTRCPTVQTALSQLDGLEPVMDSITAGPWDKPVVFLIDREADSVAHYRRWDAAGKKFVIRANESRRVLHEGREQRLVEVAKDLSRQMRPAPSVLHKGKPAEQFIAETTVVLNRPAYQHRVQGRGKHRRKKHKLIVGPAITLRLTVAEVRDPRGKVLARWLLLSNLPASVQAATLALWYYWRWRIESYHKLLKNAGQQVEQWQQESAATLVRRLLVTAMAAVLVWHIARDNSPSSRQLRSTLVKLSGRQIKRSNPRGFTDTALLAGLCIAVPMMTLLETMTVEELKATADEVMPLIRSIIRPRQVGSG